MSQDTVHSAELHSSTEVFEINSLPLQLLPKIFMRLNAHDRKNVRLTCRLWNEVCNLREIIEYEKFVFHLGKEGCGFPDLGAHIQECEALRSCLEFQGLALWRLPSTLWANIGERVESLFIHECEVDNATILNIIIHCINLKTLHLQSVDDLCRGEYEESDEYHTVGQPDPPPTVSDATGEFFTEEGIDEMIKRNIERRNLTSLIWYSNVAKSLSTRKLRKLFQIFPCLQTLDQGRLIFKYSDGIDLHRHRKREWIIPPTMEISESNVEDDILKSLKASNSKLKEFSTLLDFDFTLYDLFLNFCYEQKELEKLVLDVTGLDADGTDILFLILRSMPKLKELEFHVDSYPKFWYSSEKLSEFFVLTSKLESMWLNFRYGYPEDQTSPIMLLSPLTEYCTLKSLTVSEMINPNFVYEILRRCRTSLQHLSVTVVNDELLELILESHTELKTLSTSLYFLDTVLGVEGKKYPFWKLRNLEYLRIGSIDPDTLRNNVSEFIFPKLRCFDVHCFTGMRPYLGHVVVQDFHAMLRVVCKGAPYLENLKVNISFFNSMDFVNNLRNVQMKYLRYITIHSLIDPNTGMPLTTGSDRHFGSIDAVFNVCPSLCSISFVKGGCCTYFYNRHSKEVKRYKYLRTFDFIQTAPMISCHRPHKLC